MRNNNKTIINYTQLDFINKALCNIGHEMQLNIYADTPIYTHDSPKLKFTVNWGGFGSVDAETARDYAKMISEAANIVEKLERMNFTLDYEKPALKIRTGSKGSFDSIFKYFQNAVRYMRADDIERYLNELTKFCEVVEKEEKAGCKND